MIFISPEQKLAVQPDFPSIFATESKFYRHGFGAFKFGVSISDRLFEGPKDTIDVYHSIFVVGDKIPPLCPRCFLSQIVGIPIYLPFRRKYPIKTQTVCVLERPDYLPTHQESEVPWQIHFLPQAAQFVHNGLDLIHVSRRAQRLPINERFQHRFLCRVFSRRFFQQPLDGVTSQLRAWIIKHSGKQARRRFRRKPHKQLVGITAGARMMTGVQKKFAQFNKRQRAPGGQLAVNNCVRRRPQPIQA